MLRILHFYKTYYPDSYGGIEQVIFQLCERAQAYGVDSTVLALSQYSHCESKSLGQHHIAYSAVNFEFASTPFSFSAIARFRQLAAEADVVHFHFPYPFMDIVHFLAANNKPTVVTYHSDIVKQKFILRIYTPLMHYFLRDVDRIVASSPNYVATSPILQHYLTKVSVIPFGLDPASYPPADKAREAQWHNRLFSERFFLFIGAFRYYKGLHTLIEAACSAPYPIVLIGVGPMEIELKKRSAKLGLNNIHFLGALPDVDKAALLESCYSVVFPSHLRSEAFGITLLEGAMYGKPLISCEIGTGTTYINIHQQTGLVVPPASPTELASAMRQLWQNPIKARRYGEQALERFNALFTSTRMVSNYADIYHELAGYDKEERSYRINRCQRDTYLD